MRQSAYKRLKQRNEFDYDKLVNTISVHQEIDYDKLAVCIEKALTKHEKKENKLYSGPREWMKYVMHASLDCMGVLFGVITAFSFALIIAFVGEFLAFPKGQGVMLEMFFPLLKAAGSCALLFFSLSMTLISVFMGKEIEKIDDFSVIATLFSNVTSLVALIVALAALFRGVF